MQFDKINIYRERDFFRTHKDTPRPNVIASAVLVLNHSFSGGELMLDTGERIGFSGQKWIACFLPDVAHKIQKVTSGTRVSLSLHITRQWESDDIEIPDSLPVAIQNFVDSEGALGILLAHGYNEDEFELKGIDAKLQPLISMAKRENVIVAHEQVREVCEGPDDACTSATVYRCTREDWNWLVEDGNKPPIFPRDHPIPIFSLIPDFWGGWEGTLVDSEFQEGADHTGNSSLPETIKNVYFRQLLVFTKANNVGEERARQECDG